MSGTNAPGGDPSAAAELDTIRRRVLNVVGHELRTPVATIHGLATELAGAADPADVRDVIAPALLRNADRLTRLLDDLLVAAGIRTALPAEAPQHVDLAAVLADIWAALDPGPLEVRGHAPPVTAPPSGLRRALLAVLENAAAYGSDRPVVTLAVTGPTVTVEVFSPGPALSEQEARLATEAFFRGERAVTTRAGLGMGLAIALAVAEQVGGTLSFATAAGGTTTTVSLPKAPSDDQASTDPGPHRR